MRVSSKVVDRIERWSTIKVQRIDGHGPVHLANPLRNTRGKLSPGWQVLVCSGRASLNLVRMPWRTAPTELTPVTCARCATALEQWEKRNSIVRNEAAS